MSDKELLQEILKQIASAIQKILRRFEPFSNSAEFIDTEKGQDMLDSICMQLIAIGESLKNIDKITQGTYFSQYPEIDWKKAKGLRDIMSQSGNNGTIQYVDNTRFLNHHSIAF